MYAKPLVPDSFQVPEQLETARFRLRTLSVHDAVKDFDAVMSSAERLRRLSAPGKTWPEGLTLEQNLIELAWHQVEFQKRTSFAYTVVRLDETQILGCLYLYPTARDGHDAQVTMWVRESEAETGLDEALFATVKAWIAEAWPFEHPGYPGREISWEDWVKLPEG